MRQFEYLVESPRLVHLGSFPPGFQTLFGSDSETPNMGKSLSGATWNP